jgi:Ca-activated chloride channel family protein
MNVPKIDLIPLRHAVCSDAPLTLDVLVRIVPAAPGHCVQRPAINLGLVLDRSGSMAGLNKIQYAREAAIYAVEQLLSADRVSVTIFDDVVQTIVPNTPATDPATVVRLLRDVHPRGSTALHPGWSEGANQVGRFLLPGGLNRVLLLSDGLANVGLTQPDAIATDVKRRSSSGVSTSTMGVGKDYNEDLLQAMAASGDGNYYFIDSPRQLADVFQTELRGLTAAVGQRASLGIEPLNGVTVAEVLNDFDRNDSGRLKLPNLIAGLPIKVLVRLHVPPMARRAELCRFRLAWDAPGGHERQTLYSALSLPAVPAVQWQALPANAEVHERATLLVVARLKIQATRQLDRGDGEAARLCVEGAKELLGTLPPSAQTEQEARALAALEESLERGDQILFAKQAKYQHYWCTKDRPGD